jgi:AcrR family transcriptional regulator
VVAAALVVADAEGVDAVTMRRLAEELSVHPTSLYNHLPTKEAILDAMVDALIADAALPQTYESWQDWVHAMADGMRNVARAHPRAFLVLTQRAAIGPTAREVTEAALDAFRRGGFTPQQASEAVAAVSLATLGVALNECPPTSPFVTPEFTEDDARRFPRIAEAVAQPVGPDALDRVWRLVVDGLINELNGHVAAPVQESRASAHRRVRRHTR